MGDEARVVVVDVKIPFWSMVVLMVKWALAAVPALIILLALAWAASAVLGWLPFHFSWSGRGMV